MGGIGKMQPLIQLVSMEACSPVDVKTSCVDRMREALIHVAKNYGYTYARYVFCRRADTVKNSDTWGFYISSFPADFEHSYRDNNCISIDPLMRYTQDSNSSTYMSFGTWHGLKDMALASPLGNTSAENDDYRQAVIDMYALCDSYNIRDGIFITIEQNNTICWLSLAGELPPDKHNKTLTNNIWVELKHSLILLDSLMISTTGCDRCHPGISVDNKKRVKLTDKQIELLKVFCANPGASLGDVAAILGVTINTVNYHLWGIRDKLDMKGSSGLALAHVARDLGIF